MKKIPCDEHTLISATNQIKNHNRAVEELVYNALDAGATSIAIRINIQENIIQVIDNGCGVSSKDYNSIGQKYMTSKFIDLTSLKSASDKYGFRGEALANIINVSKSVKVTSRHECSKETWVKLFEYGTEKLIKKCTTRPSMGTTVEIAGFLYNLNIQKTSKAILGDLQSIKSFLEHISLIHCSTSLSLRDDSKNEIIFKIHKNRDIYQTLSTLYNMGKNNLQELQVEKSEYKVTAYLGKSNETGKHLIFLNGKFISNSSKLHKIVNHNLSKQLKVRGIQKSKMKNTNTEEESNWIQKTTPDYFIFIKCPYKDYDLSNSPKQSVLEFKDWDQINKLLEKLTNIFNGSVNLKEATKVNNIQPCDKVECNSTREQVKKIMEKIMGTHSKKPGISHMHNAINGKQVKRKRQKTPKLTVTGSNGKHNGDNYSKCINGVVDINNSNHSNKAIESDRTNKQVAKTLSKTNATKPCLKTIVGQKLNFNSKNKRNRNESNVQLKKTMIRKNKKKKSGVNKDVILRKFEMNTDSVKKRCDKLEQRTRYLMDRMHKEACNMLVNENIALGNNIPKKQINISVRKQIDEILIHNNGSKKPNCKLANEQDARENIKQKLVQSNYDLLQTILKTQQEHSLPIRNAADELNNTAAIMSPPRAARVTGIGDSNKPKQMVLETNCIEPMITFKSHHYYTHQKYNTENNSYHSHAEIQNENQHGFHNEPRMFITKQSRENFAIPNRILKSNNFKKKNLRTGFSKQFQSHIKSLFKKTSKLFDLKKQIMGSTCESSYTIEFTESIYRLTNNKNVIMNDAIRNTRMSIEETLPHVDNHSSEKSDYNSINTSTYVVANVDENGYTINNDDHWTFCGTYTTEKNNGFNSQIQNDRFENNRNFIFVSKSEEHDRNEQIADPIDVCETILRSEEMLDKEFGQSFSDMQNNMSNKPIYSTNSQGNYKDSIDGCFYSKENKEVPDDQNQNVQKIHAQDNINEVSHHFSLNRNGTNKVDNVNENTNPSPILASRQSTTIGKQLIEEKGSCEVVNESHPQGFNFMNRLCFLPKGMSPIFQNCQTNNACDYNLSRDYYEKEMYNNFTDDVRNNAVIFEQKIQNAKEITTKAMDKVTTKLFKDNSALKFNGQCLEDAKILGQIDEKFIAAIMKERNNAASMDYLVLFDQHAVHERIRLENNLTDYFNGNQWKPVEIDAVSLTLSKDKVLYLHNFKDKFEQLGLLWTVKSVNEVSVVAIPEPILGKNPRPVEKVIKAVKNLIAEEINIIKIQGGCVSLYPKSIMDLVFSEACRYAIKFGDKLSKSECLELLKTLSGCKTPFQCAHGRPVMAVIMETRLNRIDYKINLEKIMEWKRKL